MEGIGYDVNVKTITEFKPHTFQLNDEPNKNRGLLLWHFCVPVYF
jgi:hypothetical protein